MTLYTILKFVHIILAILAVGFNSSYSIWITRAEKAPEHSAYILKVVKFLDDYLANPCYLGLFATGVVMCFILGADTFRLFWIWSSMALLTIAMIVAYSIYTPTLRKQIEMAGTKGVDSPEYKALTKKGTAVGASLGFISIVIVGLMVFKPV